MTAYDLYKPFRNYMRQFPVMDSLEVIRAYSQHLQFGQPMPRNIETHRTFQMGRNRIEKGIVEWELDILTKELILNGDTNIRYSLRNWDKLTKAVGMLRDLENDLHGEHRDILRPNILMEAYRISHRQFPWQRSPDERAILRYFKIFGHPDFSSIMESKMQTTASELYTFGLALVGNYMTTFGFNSAGQIDIPNVRQSSWESFKENFSTPLAQLKLDISAAQSYDQDYAYKVNPLRYKPLVRLQLNGQETLAAPIPTFLYKAFTEGVFYKLINENDFANIFGKAYARYVGEVLNVCNIRQAYVVLPEAEYYIGADRHDTADWIISDASGDLFIECKAKKLRQDSRVKIASRESLEKDLDIMSDAIVQVYRTLNDALNGAYPHWTNRSLPIYPVILTLEEWYLYGPQGHVLLQAINTKAIEKLTALNLDVSLLGRYPYSILSVDDLELGVQIMERRTIDVVMAERFRDEYKLWIFLGFLRERFREDFMYLNGTLFPDEWARINPLINQ